MPDIFFFFRTAEVYLINDFRISINPSHFPDLIILPSYWRR